MSVILDSDGDGFYDDGKSGSWSSIFANYFYAAGTPITNTFYTNSYTTTIGDISGDGAPDVNLLGATSSAIVNGATFGHDIRGAGTGNFNDFLGIQDAPNEYGFNGGNTDGSNPDIKTSNNFTHPIKLSEIAIITVDGVDYYQFLMDANENNSGTNYKISLDTFQLFLSSSGTIGTKTDLFNQKLVYDIDDSNPGAAGGEQDISLIVSDQYSSGSGRSDLSVLIPVDQILSGLTGNQTPFNTYLYMYNELGFADPIPDSNGRNGYDNPYDTDATFEEWRTVSAGGLTGVKFNDADGDGVKDGGESGIGGVTVFADMQTFKLDGNKLVLDRDFNGVLDADEQSTITAQDGTFSFFGLPLGTYHIWEQVPAGYIRTTGDYETVTITSIGQVVTGVEIGNFNPIDISGTKYTDANGDGQITNDVGLVGVTIFIDSNGDGDVDATDNNGVLDAGELSTTTAANGTWSFSNLGPGYIGAKVLEVLPSGYVQTLGSAGYTITGDATNLNFGNFQLFDVSGYKWTDSDGDGVWDGTENALPGWTVYLRKDADNNGSYETLVDTKVTDGTGKYSFTNLGPGHYQVTESTSDTDWTNTYVGTWTFDGVSGQDRNVAAGTATPGNFGNFQLFDVSGYKWTDSDGDGVWDGTENALPGWTVYLRKDADNDGSYETLVDTKVTDGTGKYSFTNLGPGHYQVTESTSDTDWTNTYVGTWTFDGVSGQDRNVAAGTATPGNFGNFQLFDVSGYKWTDSDGDGVWDGTENALPGWTVYLRKDADNDGSYETLVDTKVTDGTGKYSFTNLGPGHYQVTEASQTGWVNTYDGTWEFIGQSGVDLTAAIGATTDGNFGNFELMNISGYKWNDINGDGLWSGGEGTLATWTIVLDSDNIANNGNEIATAVTDANGFYSFTDLGPDIDQNGDGIVYVYEKIEAGFNQTYGNFSFNIASGLVIEGSLNTTEQGNFGNHMLGGYTRTPGFWQNKTWQDFWDGDSSVPKQAGQTGFPDLVRGDLLIYGHTDGTRDSDGNGSTSAALDKGLLIGDWNHNGINDSLGLDGLPNTGDEYQEDTIFIRFNDALTLIKATDDPGGAKGNGINILGRDVVATWLNYLAGANVGGDDAPGDPSDLTPKHFVSDAVDWLQQFASNQNPGVGAAANSAIFEFDTKVGTSSGSWQKAQDGTGGQPNSGIDHSASVIHAELDYYNNTGATYDPSDPSMIYHFSLHAP